MIFNMMSYNLKLDRLVLCISQLRYWSSSQQNGKSIVVEHLDYITTIGINRPEKRNSINKHTAVLLNEAIENFEEDDKARAAVLYGIGGNFCAGADFEELAKSGKYEDAFIGKDTIGPTGPTRKFIKKPLIAAISGYAVGGGLELAAMCDLRVMEETAIIGVFNRRFGVPLINGGTVRLTAMLGLSRALDLILTGRSLTAKEAFEWGFANRIVACGTGLGQAINLASCVIKYPQMSLLADRQSAHNAAYKCAFNELLQFEKDNATQAVKSESVEGAKIFLSGLGRHGKSFMLLEKDIPEWESDSDKGR